MSSLEVRAPSGAYEVRIGAGLLADPDSWTGWPSASSAVVVTNATVAGHWSEALMRGLRTAFGKITQVELPDGEDHKDWPTLNRIFDHLLAHKCDRQTLLIALGGGVVGDITGFAAGCYMRGIAYVQVPTTLLAQVDSSVGGKTAINHPLGKNMIGLFHQPQRVICDLDTLGTLPQREFVAGLAEVIKYGPIADEAFLRWLEANLDALLSRDAAALAHAVRRSCEIKAQVVGADERESGLRAILNFGHTFGHAIEAGLGYGQWLHGEAVGCGMRMATDLSVRLELVPPETLERMQTLLDRAGLPRSAPAWPADRWWSLMGHDKKAQVGSVRFVLLDRIGHALMRTAPRVLVDDVVAAAGRGWR